MGSLAFVHARDIFSIRALAARVCSTASSNRLSWALCSRLSRNLSLSISREARINLAYSSSNIVLQLRNNASG